MPERSMLRARREGSDSAPDNPSSVNLAGKSGATPTAYGPSDAALRAAMRPTTYTTRGILAAAHDPALGNAASVNRGTFLAGIVQFLHEWEATDASECEDPSAAVLRHFGGGHADA